MKRSSVSKGVIANNEYNREIEWELRPGGMLVQKRDAGNGSSSAMIKIKVSYGSYLHDLTVPDQSTFGDLKRVLAQETGLEPKEQRLLFRGKEKDDEECLHMIGVKDMSKVILFEDPASKQRKLEEMKRNQGILKAYEDVVNVRIEIDKLAKKVVALEAAIRGGAKVANTEFIVLTELLIMQLLKLNSINTDGEAKAQRRIEVRRVQSFVDTIDILKARNSNPFSSSSNAASMRTKWETFESGVGSLSATAPLQSSTKITQDWEVFD